MALTYIARDVSINDGTEKEIFAAEITTLGVYHLRICSSSIPNGNVITVKVTDKVGNDATPSILLLQELRPGEAGQYPSFVLKNAGHATVQRTSGSGTFTLYCDATVGS